MMGKADAMDSTSLSGGLSRMIELYGSLTPSTYMITIMLEEIKLSYTVFPVTKENSETLELELSKFPPHHNFPIILDRSKPAADDLVAIFEPSAILMYLAEKTGQFMPKIGSEKFDVLQWLLFENSKIGPIFGNSKHFMFNATENVPYAVKRFNNETKRICSIIEKQLTDNKFLAGEYSIADMAAFPWIKEFEKLGIDEDEIPNICDWLERLNKRKATQTGWDALANLRE